METVIQPRLKMIISVIAVLAVLLGALVSVVLFNSPQSEVAGEYQENYSVRLKEDYRNDFKKIISRYLDQTESAESLASVLTGTIEAKNSILSLRVASESKEFHLQSILLLTSIESLAQKGEAESVALKLNELRAFLKDF